MAAPGEGEGEVGTVGPGGGHVSRRELIDDLEHAKPRVAGLAEACGVQALHDLQRLLDHLDERRVLPRGRAGLQDELVGHRPGAREGVAQGRGVRHPRPPEVLHDHGVRHLVGGAVP